MTPIIINLHASAELILNCIHLIHHSTPIATAAGRVMAALPSRLQCLCLTCSSCHILLSIQTINDNLITFFNCTFFFSIHQYFLLPHLLIQISLMNSLFKEFLDAALHSIVPNYIHRIYVSI